MGTGQGNQAGQVVGMTRGREPAMEGGEQVPQGGKDGRAEEAGKRQRAVGAQDTQGPPGTPRAFPVDSQVPRGRGWRVASDQGSLALGGRRVGPQAAISFVACDPAPRATWHQSLLCWSVPRGVGGGRVV